MSKEAQDKYKQEQKNKRKSGNGKGRRSRENNKTETTSRDAETSATNTETPENQPREVNMAKREENLKYHQDFIQDDKTGHTYQRVEREVSQHKLRYHHTMKAQQSQRKGSLIDGGANGGFAGSDVRIESTSKSVADITGLADKRVQDVPIGTALGRVMSTSGHVVLVMNQYALYGEGRTIHSIGQMESFGLDVDDRSKRTPNQSKAKDRRPRTQCIKTPDGYVIPLHS